MPSSEDECSWETSVLCLPIRLNRVQASGPQYIYHHVTAISHSCPMMMETTHVSETSTLYIHTPGNYPKEDNIRYTELFITP
jgi:hypothetical protein